MKKRAIIAAVFTVCLALCAAVWPQTEMLEGTLLPSETAAVTAPQPTPPETEERVLPAIVEKQESGMPEVESAPEVPAEELPISAPKIEDDAETEPESVPSMQTDFAAVHSTQSEPEPLPKPEPMVNDNGSADMAYVPGFGWMQSEGPNHVGYAEDVYENGNKIGIMG